jgi:tetratricopeptide (TPR) repeat protein
MAEDIAQAPKNHKRRKKLIILGIIVLVLAVGIGLGVRWWLQQRDYERQSEPDAIVETMEDAQNYMFAGDFDQAHDVVDRALDNPRLSDQAKFDLYLQQGATFESQENYSAALESYRKAEALQPDAYGVILTIANLATLMEDNALALEYFRKAIPLLPEDDPLRETNRQYLEDWVTILEEGGPRDEE